MSSLTKVCSRCHTAKPLAEFYRNRYRAQIGSTPRRDLGWFTDPVEAAQAYDRAAIEIYGEFVRLNFPGEPAGSEVGP